MRVLVVDDHPLFRAGILALLAGLDSTVQAGEAGSVAEAAEQAAAGVDADLVLLDMNLPGVGRIDAIRRIKALFESASVVVVSADDDPWLIRGAIDAGAAGYIPKTTDAALTVQALRLVLAQGVYLPASAVQALARPAGPPGVPCAAGGVNLSARQQEVLCRLLQGKPNKAIARELDIAEGTVKAHLWSIYQALGVSSRAQALYRAHELGLLPLAGRAAPGSPAERS